MAQDTNWENGSFSAPVAADTPDWESGEFSAPPKRSLAAAANDTVIEFANAAAGGASAAANFVKPGNVASRWIDKNIVQAGEDKQSDAVKAEKARLSSDLAGAGGMGDEAAAVGRYIVNNPLLSAAQAAGSFVGPGLAVKGAGLAARAAGAGAQTATRAGRAGGVAAGVALAGGDAAGTAYDLASKAGATEDQAVSAGRQASVIPAIVGGVTGAFGAEKLLAGAKGFTGGTAARALKTGASEALQEGVEEGVTQYEGQRAAVPYDPSIDPMKGVAGAATMGAALGGITGAGVGALDGVQHRAQQRAQEQAAQSAEDTAQAPAGAAPADAAPPAMEPATAQPDTPPGAQDQSDPVVQDAAAPTNDPLTPEQRIAQLEERLSFIQQQAKGNGWDQRLIGARDEAMAELDALRPAPEASAATPAVDTRPLSQQMGIDRTAGPLSKIAATAVDTGATPVQFLGATGRALQTRQTGPGVTNESNVIDVQGRVVEDRAIGTPRRLIDAAQPGASQQPAGRQALPAPTNLREALDRIRQQRAEGERLASQSPAPGAAVPALGGPTGDDRARSPSLAIPDGSGANKSNAERPPAVGAGGAKPGAAQPSGRGNGNAPLRTPTSLREGLERIRAQRQEAANAQAAARQAAAAAQSLPAAGTGAVEADGVKTGGFDSAAFDNARANTIKASKAAGNKHLDEVPAYVESMRGKQVYYAHDNKVRGVIRTVDNRGNVYIDWADSYSAEKEMASPVKDGKKTVMRSSIGPTDLKDYVVGQPKVPAANVQPTTEGANLVPQASQTQQGSTQPTQAGGPARPAATAAPRTAPAGGSGLQTGGLTNAAPAQNAGAQGTAASGTQGQAQAASATNQAGRLDHGELNIPGRTSGIDAELDRHKAAQASQTKADTKRRGMALLEGRKQARQLLKQHGDAMVRSFSSLEQKAARRELDGMATWEPDRLIAMVERWQAEQGGKPNEAVARQDGWRKSMLKAGPVAKAMGIETRGKRLAQVVAEIDAADAQRAGVRQELAAQPVPATHADPGEKAEAATSAVVTDSLKRAARNEDTKPSEMRKWLVAEIDKELLQAPDRADYDEAVKRLGEKDAISGYTGNGPLGKNSETGFITFDVPGDGKYKVRNSVRGLLEFRKNVMASQGFKDSGQKRAKPDQNDGVQGGSGGNMAAITNMIEEGDFEAARDYAEAVGVKLEDVKVPRGENAPAWKVFLSTGKVPEQKPVSREWTVTNEQNHNGTWSRVAKLKRTADGAEYEATVTGTLDNTRATYVLTKDGKEYSRMTSGQPFSAAIELAENAMPAANDKPAPSKANDTGWNMAGTGYGGKRYIGRNITLDDGREVVARVYENAGNYDEVEIKVDGARKFTVRDSFNAQDKADAFIKTLTSKDGGASAPVAEPPALAGRTYLAVPFSEKDYAKRAGAKWDEGKKLWYADPVGGDGAAAGEININLKQYVPQDSTKDDRYNYYGDKALATAVALNASARDGVQYDTIKRKHPDGMMMWSVVKAGEQTQAAPAAQPAIPAGYKPAGEPFYRGGKQIQGYAPFAPGERVTMKESAGQSGVVENLTSPDDAGVFSGAMVKFDNGSTQIVKFDKLEAEAKTATGDDGRARFTVSIPVFGDVPYRASAPVDAGDGQVVSSRVITTRTKLTAANAQSLGLPKDKGTVYAWRVSVIRRADGAAHSVIEAMATDNGRSPDGEVLAHFKEVENPEAMERIAPAIANAALSDWRAAQPQQAPAATETVAQPITRADVTAAQQQAATLIAERIDAMTAGEVNTIARRFLPTMGVKPTVSKERNKAAVTDFTKVNPLAAADEFGATLPADVRRALQADMEGAVADGFVEQGDAPMFSRTKAITPAQRAENFARWSDNAPLISSEQAEVYDFKTGQKIVVEAFHGSARPDRIGGVFDPKRATSGPMAYFTSSPELASSYAKGKEDTSLADEDQSYANWFKFKPPGARSAVSIDRAWNSLTPEVQARIRKLAPQIAMDDTGENIVIDPDNTDGLGNYGWELRQARGNPLAALVESWLSSGTLFNEEIQFMDVLRMAGFPVAGVEMDFPNASYPGVFKTYVSMKNPLVVGDMPADVRAALEQAAKADRTKAKPGADMWDKRSHTLRDWWAKLNDPDPQTAAYAWTSIPDKVTDVLKANGYDGIVDWSGKGGGHQSPVYIPFAPTQVKSVFNRGTFDPTKKDISFGRGANAAIGTPAATIRTAITKAYGKLLGQLESKGLVTLTQTQEQAIEAAAQARAAKTGQSVERERARLQSSIRGEADELSMSIYSDEAGKIERALEAMGLQVSTEGSRISQSTYVIVESPEYTQTEGESGSVLKIRVSDHRLPGGYQQPDFEVQVGNAHQGVDMADAAGAWFDAVRWVGGRFGVEPKGAAKRQIAAAAEKEAKAKQAAVAAADQQRDRLDTSKARLQAWLQSLPDGALWGNARRGGWVAVLDGKMIGRFDGETATGEGQPWYGGPYPVEAQKNLQPVRESLRASVKNSVADPDIRRSADGAIQGFFDPQTGQSFLVADNLTAEAAPGVLMHEVGIHMAADGSMKALFNRAAMMLKMQRGNPFMKAVQARMDAAGETSGEEAAAYIAEAYENDRANAPASVQRWLADLLAAVKAWMFKKGIMGADRLTVADIAAVARANARSMARDGGATGGQGFGTAFSRVWHGSPHKFLQFDSSKIGTGEGAQAYGYGLYLAESKGVAGSYQESLSTDPERFLVDGKEVFRRQANGPAFDVSDPKTAAIFYAARKGDKAAREYFAEQGAWGGKAIAELDAMKGKAISRVAPGNLYQVDLPDEHIAKMLDWDKPLSEQTPEVRKLAEKFGYPLDRTGGDFQRWSASPSGGLSINLRGPRDRSGLEKQSANMFSQAGIPGIRYLDSSSRGNGAGTSNYVIFPGMEKILTILDVNGEPVTGAEKAKVLGEQMDLAFSRTPGDQTQTEAFKRWFAGSKVVDGDGQPLQVFHGTPDASFTQFKEGAHFTADPNYAAIYTHPSASSINSSEKRSEAPATMPVYLAIRKPFDTRVSAIRTVFEKEFFGQWGNGTPLSERGLPDWTDARDLLEWIEETGQPFDGILVDEGGTPDGGHRGFSWVPTKPTQIKSATGNSGTFDPDNPDIRFSRSVAADGAAQRAGDAIKAVSATNLKQRADWKATDYLGLGLQTLGRRQIVDIYGDALPLAQYNKLAAQMEADKNEVGANADKLATAWGKLKDERQLAELMHDATLAQMDPAKEHVPGDDQMRYKMLRARFNALTPEAKQVYLDARSAYQAHHANVRQAIKDRIERSELKGERKAALLKQMDDEFFKAVKGVYFPLARFGQYVVVVKDADGKVASVNRAETMAEAQALRTSLLKAFPAGSGHTVARPILGKEFIAGRDAVGRGFMTELYAVLDKQDMDAAARAELEDTLGQLYLSSLPDLSWAKHGIHRKGTPGFSQDARRAYAQNMFHGARYLAKLRYSDLMQDELNAMQQHVDDWKEVEDFDQPKAQRVVDEMNKRHESLMNPKSNPLSTALTSFGFIFHLGLSPASAMVNLSQTALVAYPIIGAKWGFGKASAALLKASGEAARGKNDITGALTAQERQAYDEAVRTGVIDVTMAHDLAGISQGEDAGVMWKLRPVMKWASFMFHHAERFNRQVTFVAAYRLAREAGASHESAYEQAADATYKGHFDYSASNRPRIMQGNTARVLLLFKQYSQNMIYTLARSAHQSLKGATPEARAEARKTLGGLLTMHAAAAGVLGLPMVTTLLAAASMLGGDDDEPWDAQVALQNLLADTFGQKSAEVLAHGLSRLTPWDVSGRVGLDRLIFPDVQEGLEGQRLAESAMAAALGPVAGIGVNVLKGVQEMSQGRYLRGLEAMAPSVARGPLKALRYESEGVKDKTGIVVQDEVDAAALWGQVAGFSPSDVRRSYEGKSAIVQHDRALQARRSALVEQFAMAAMAGDESGKTEAREDIAKFNEKNPARRILPLNLMQSVAQRQKRIREAREGVYLPAKRRDAMEQGRFAAPL